MQGASLRSLSPGPGGMAPQFRDRLPPSEGRDSVPSSPLAIHVCNSSSKEPFSGPHGYCIACMYMVHTHTGVRNTHTHLFQCCRHLSPRLSCLPGRVRIQTTLYQHRMKREGDSVTSNPQSLKGQSERLSLETPPSPDRDMASQLSQVPPGDSVGLTIHHSLRA